MRASTKAIQQSFWTDQEMNAMPSTVESFLGHKGKRLPDREGIKKPVVLRVNIFDYDGKKIWFGDIDIGKDSEALLSLSAELGPLYLLQKAKARFLTRPSARFIRNIAEVVVEAGHILYIRDLALKLGIIRKPEPRADGGKD